MGDPIISKARAAFRAFSFHRRDIVWPSKINYLKRFLGPSRVQPTGLSLALICFMDCSLVCLNHKVEPEQANEGHFVTFVCLL